MSVLAESVRLPVTQVFDLFSDVVDYEQGVLGPVQLRLSMRSLRADDLFGSAAQGDRLGVVKAQEFDTVVGAAPERYGRFTINGTPFTVQEWKPAPATGMPIFYRFLLRGGRQ